MRPSGAILALVVAFLAVALPLAAVWHPSLISPDAAEYLSVARSLMAGRGAQTSIVFYEEHLRIGGIPVPETVFPPGYPLLLAAARAVGIPFPGAAFDVGLLCLGLSGFVLYDLARRLGRSSAAGVVLACSLIFSATAWKQALNGDSELPFVLMTLLALRALAAGSDGAHLLAGVCAAAAVAVRYAGIFFVIALGLGLLVSGLKELRRVPWRRLLLAAGPPAFMAAGLFLRNAALASDVRGGNAATDPDTLPQILVRLRRGISGLLGAQATGLRAGHPGEWLYLAAGLVAAGLWLRCRKDVALSGPSRLLGRVPAVCAAYLVTSLVLLVYLERTAPINIGARILLPLVPFAAVLLLEASATLAFASAPAQRGAAAVAALLVAAYAAGQADVATERDFLARVRQRREMHRCLESAATLQELHAEAAAARPVLCSHVYVLGVLLDQPLIGLAEAQDTERVWTNDEVLALVRRYDVSLVVLHPDAFNNSGNEAFFAGLRDGALPAWLSLERVEPGVRFYRVRDRTEAGGARWHWPT